MCALSLPTFKHSNVQTFFCPDPQTSAKSVDYKVPYILPSSVYSNPFVFTLFSKLPGCSYFLTKTERSSTATLPWFPPPKNACADFRSSHQSPVTNHQSLSSLECAVPRFRALTPLECAVTKTRPRKSFRMRSCEKRWGGGVILPFSIFTFPFSRPSRHSSATMISFRSAQGSRCKLAIVEEVS